MTDQSSLDKIKRPRGRPRKAPVDPKDVVVFLWMMPHKEVLILMEQSSDRVDINGIHPDKLGRTILVRNGLFETSDAAEIAFLRNSPDFEGDDPSKSFVEANDLARQLITALRSKGIDGLALHDKMKAVMSAMSDGDITTEEPANEPERDPGPSE